jgi:hypothetical protein
MVEGGLKNRKDEDCVDLFCAQFFQVFLYSSYLQNWQILNAKSLISPEVKIIKQVNMVVLKNGI